MTLELISAASDYWTKSLPEKRRRSDVLFSLTAPVCAMRVVARSAMGGQLLCVLPSGEMRFYMLKEETWTAVGNFLLVDGGGLLLGQGIQGGSITRHEGVCVLFKNGTMAVTSVSDIFHGIPCRWCFDYERIESVRVGVIEQYSLIVKYLGSDATPAASNEYMADFITVHDTARPLSIMTLAGRPKFSIDKKIRPCRSRALPPLEEANCLFALMACLWTMFPPPGIETVWSVDTTVMRLFAETYASRTMAKWRGAGLPLASQLRRWLPFCKQLVLRTSYFNVRFSTSFIASFEGVHQNEKWIRSRGADVSRIMRTWLDTGMPASAVFDTESAVPAESLEISKGGLITAHEWMSSRRLHFRVQKRPRLEWTQASASILESEVGAVVSQEIAALEHMRTAIMGSDVKVGGGAFESLVHGITAHLRNAHTVTALALKLTETSSQGGVIGAQIVSAAEELAHACGDNADIKKYVQQLTSGCLLRISSLTASEILSKSHSPTLRHAHAVRLITDGLCMLAGGS